MSVACESTIVEEIGINPDSPRRTMTTEDHTASSEYSDIPPSVDEKLARENGFHLHNGSTDHVGKADSRGNQEPTAVPYDHTKYCAMGRTYFLPEEADGPILHSIRGTVTWDYLKKWNDGFRDKDRQNIEGFTDKLKYPHSFGQRLSLPRDVIGHAKMLVVDIGDVKRLGGDDNNIHRASFGALVLSYERLWHCQNYRSIPSDDTHRWCERSDFRELWEGLDMTEQETRTLAKKIGRKTDVPYRCARHSR